MKAVILSGGLGTRMRPLTYGTPKPLLPLLNRPMVEHILDRLPPEVDEVVMAANYLIEQLRDHFRRREEEGTGPVVRVVDEPEPRGTGGAVRNAGRYLDDTFLAFNGDIISSLDLEAYVDYHRNKGGIGCLALWEVPDPSRFGVVRFGVDMAITSFVEKPQTPPGQQPAPEWINAGMYVFEPEILDHIEPDRKVSFEREVFPGVLDRGLYAHPFRGYWVDAGKPQDFLAAQRALFSDPARGGGGMVTGRGDGLEGEAGLRGPVLLGGGCDLAPGCLVGPNVTLGRDVILASSVTVQDSILMDGVWVGEGSVINGSILGPGSRVGSGAVLEAGSVLGDGEKVEEGRVRRAEENETGDR